MENCKFATPSRHIFRRYQKILLLFVFDCLHTRRRRRPASIEVICGRTPAGASCSSRHTTQRNYARKSCWCARSSALGTNNMLIEVRRDILTLVRPNLIRFHFCAEHILYIDRLGSSTQPQSLCFWSARCRSNPKQTQFASLFKQMRGFENISAIFEKSPFRVYRVSRVWFCVICLHNFIISCRKCTKSPLGTNIVLRFHLDIVSISIRN